MSEKHTIDYISLGDKLRKKRDELGLTQATVSEKLGISESFYGHIERGDRIASMETLIRLARLFNVSLDYLLMDSIDSDGAKQLHTELDNLFRDKTPAQIEYLLRIIRVLSSSIAELQP